MRALPTATEKRSQNSNQLGLPPRILSEDRFPPGHCDRRARHVARQGIGEHHVSRRKFGGLAGALHRHVLSEILDCLFRHCRGNEGRPDRARRDRVGANALFREQLRKARGEVLDCALGRGVGQQGLGSSEIRHDDGPVAGSVRRSAESAELMSQDNR